MKICHSEPRLVFDGVRNQVFPWPFCEQQIPHPETTRIRDDKRGFFRRLTRDETLFAPWRNKLVFSMNFYFIFGLLVAALCSGSQALAQESSPAFHGVWTATAATGQVLRGTWSGQASPQGPNTVRGSWTLLSEASDILLEGTWSARKTDKGWQGFWTARISNGGSFAGTWNADLPDFSGKTMEEMLKRTAEKQIAGSWRSGRHQGNWWLDGSVAKGGRR